ncbi:MAG: GNAT family N-acetyltransferase [Gemmatimonadaceae bacterium]
MAPSGTDLRLAGVRDVPELQDLIGLSVRALSAGIYTPAQIEAALVHVFGVDSQLVADGTYYVIEDAGTLVAAGGWSSRQRLYGGDQARGEPDPTLDPATTPARIRAFFVHPGWIRRGLARWIYQACQGAAKARGFRAFDVVATLPGEPLYRALGFAPVETISIALPGDLVLPCVRMRCPIDA